MYAEIFFIAAQLAGTSVSQPNLVDAISVVRDVAIEESPLDPSGGDEDYVARLLTAKVLAVWWWHEARFRVDVHGDQGRGDALGPLQVHRQWMTPAEQIEVRRDARAGLRVGLRLMRRMVAWCGSVEGGLRAYSSGRCSGARQLVAARCAAIGGCQ